MKIKTVNSSQSSTSIISKQKYKKSNNKHDWNPVKYLNVFHHNRTKKQL